MPVRNYKIEKLFGPSFSFTGYAFIAGGIIALRYSYYSFLLIVAGAFISFTSSGTLIDTDRKRVKQYVNVFGIIRTGKWIKIDNSSVFKISKSRRRYTTYSRANLANSISITDIKLELVIPGRGKRIVVNRFRNYEEASREMNDLSDILKLKHEPGL